MTNKINKQIDIEKLKSKLAIAFKEQYDDNIVEIDEKGICSLAFTTDSILEEVQIELKFDTKDCSLIWLVETIEVRKEEVTLKELENIEKWDFFEVLTDGLSLSSDVEEYMVENIEEEDLESIKKMFSKDEEIDDDVESIVSEYMNNLYQYNKNISKKYLKLYLETFKKGESDV